MSMQQGGSGGKNHHADTTEDSDEEPELSSAPTAVPAVDVLGYMSDMLLELKDISDQLGLRTLSGLLALSHIEAVARQEQQLQQQKGALS